MPSRLVQHQDGMPAWQHRLTDGLEVKGHGLGIGKRQHETDCRIAPRAHGAKDICRLRLLLPHHPRPGSLACPHACLRAALPDAHLILEPDIDLFQARTAGKHRFYLLEKFFFWNAACLTGSACGLTERAVIHAMSSRLSKSYTPFKL